MRKRLINRILAIILSGTMCLSSIPVRASSEVPVEKNERVETSVDESMKENDTSEIEIPIEFDELNSRLSPPESDFSYIELNGSYISITGYNGNDTDITIPDSIDGFVVQAISENAFKDNTSLKTITFASEIESVGSYAFYGCESLNNIVFNGELKEIGSYAFEECTSLNTIDLPDSLKTIGYGAFHKCTGFTAIELPNSVTTMSGYAFAQCTNLSKINYPTSLKEGGESIFEDDTKLTSVEVPEGVTILAKQAFNTCQNIKEIKLPSTLEEIGSEALRYCTGLESIDLPEGLKKIDSYAFEGDTGIKTIELPDGLKEIGYGAFYKSGLTEIVIPDSVTTIGGSAFNGCTDLESSTYPKSLTKAEGNIYSGCTKLKEITVPEGVEVLPEDVFSDCTNFAKIILPSTLTTIGNYSFNGCTGLKEIEIPENVTKLGYSAFDGCTGLNEIVLPDGVKEISGAAFRDCTSLENINYPKALEKTGGSNYSGCTNLKSITVPDGVTVIPEDAFSGSNKLIQINLPESVTTISQYAFNGMTSLERIIIPSKVSVINYNLFNNCASLKDVWLGDEITEINDYAFNGCDKDILTIHGIEGSYVQEWAEQKGFNFSTSELGSEDAVVSGRVLLNDDTGVEGINVVIYDCVKKKVVDTIITDGDGKWVFEQAVVGEKYEVSYFHSDYSISKGKLTFIADENTELEDVIAEKIYNFEDSPSEDFEYSELNGNNIKITKYKGNDKNVIIPSEIRGSKVSQIGEDAFYQNESIELVRIPKTVTIIDNNAFRQCSKLKKVLFAGFTEKIGSYAFEECTSLNTIDLPGSLKTIGYGGFHKCTGFTTIELPNSVTNIGGYAFAQCTNLSKINYPMSLKEGGERIFEDDTKLTSVEVPEGVTILAKQVFDTCKNIKEIKLPSTLEEIGSEALSYCTGLENIKLPEGLKKIDSYAFEGDMGIKTVELPDGLKEIGYGAFYKSGLTEIIIPDSVISIGGSAFNGCVNLESSTYPKSLTKAADSIYTGCTKLKEITVPEGVEVLPEDVFSDCTNFAKIILPSTLTTIGNWSFYNCTGLKEIDLPENVTMVGYSAFAGCTGLKEVVLPDGVKEISGATFKDCTLLKSINYPKSLEKTGSSNYSGCTSLKSITVPEGVTVIPEDALCSAGNIRNIILPESVKTINDYAFKDCKGLVTITIPSSVTKIGNNAYAGCDGILKLTIPKAITEIGFGAFSKCSNLKEVVIETGELKQLENAVFADCKKLNCIYIPRNISAIDNNSFFDDEKVSFYCPYVSYATLYAIKNNIPFISSDNSFDDVEDSMINRANTYFYADLDGVAYNGFVKITLEYDIKDKVKGKQDKNIQFYIPGNVELKESTIKFGNALCQEYDYEDNILTIPIKENVCDSIVFYVKPLNNSTVMSYAQLLYDGANEILGIINEDMTVLTMNCDEEISSDFVNVSGYGPKNSKVSIFVDDSKVEEFKTSKTGKYSGKVVFSNPEDEQEYVVKAECVQNDEKHFVESVVTYSEGSPELKSLKLYYNNLSDSGVDLLNSETTPYISFNPSIPFTFTADFTNKEKIENVYIVSTRNNTKKYLEAKYDAKKDMYIASGYFDESNHSYVPGKISVDYNKKHEVQKISENYTFDTNSITPAMEKTKVSQLSGDFGVGGMGYRFDITDTLAEVAPDMAKEVGDTYIDYIVSMYDEENDSNLSEVIDFYKAMDTLQGYFIPGEDGKNWFVKADYSDPTTWTLMMKDATKTTDKIIKFKLELNSESWTRLNDIEPYLGMAAKVAGAAHKVAGYKKDNKELKEEIMMNSSIVDKESALRKADQLLDDQTNFTYLVALLPLLVKYGIGITGPVAIGFTALCGIMGAVAIYFWAARTAECKGQAFFIKWGIDPSGFVYEGVVDNRLSDVKVTAYYKEKLEDNNAILWDAGEYDQVNPLVTGSDGVYAWDVPEGFWQVKYEKDGYETVYSEWMEVPPPQTDVNIKMTPINDLGLSTVNVYSDRVEIEFNQYVEPANVKDIVLLDSEGNPISFTLYYNSDSTDVEGNHYAKIYCLQYDETLIPEDEMVTINVPNTITNGAGKNTKTVGIEKKCEKEMLINLPDSTSVELGGKVSIPISVTNYSGELIEAFSDCTAIATVEKDIIISDNKGQIIVTGELYGQATITLKCNGKKYASILINVGESTEVGKMKYKVSYLGGEGIKGSLPVSNFYEDGDTFTLPISDVTKENHVFNGWSDGNKVYKVGEEYTINGADVTFYPDWVKKADESSTGDNSESGNNKGEEGNGDSGNESGLENNSGANTQQSPSDGGNNQTPQQEITPSQPTAPTVTLAPTTADQPTQPPNVVTVSRPSKVNLSLAKNSAKKTIKVSWKKMTVDGYQVQIALNKKFTKSQKTYTTTKTSISVKKRKKGKTYFVRVRAFNVDQHDVKTYGKWSKVKKVKVKK